MKKLILIPFLFICFSVSAATYYVATDGDDARTTIQAQNIATPWATIGKAFANVVAGDIVYMRGGIYMVPASNDGVGYILNANGTALNRIVISNYESEVPIIDFVDVITGSVVEKFGLRIQGDYVDIIGITVRNLDQQSDDPGNVALARAIYIECNNTTIENCVAHDIGGHGFRVYGSNNVQVINCDAYECVDVLTPTNPGNDGSGFSCINTSITSTAYFSKCRAWLCGDQGFTAGSYGYVEHDGCWSFRNGQLEGEGWGFKLGWVNTTYTGALKRKVTNCVAAFNRRSGFDTNDGGYPAHPVHIYNNTSYHNGYLGGASAYGFLFRNTSGTDVQEQTREWRNNVAYNDQSGNYLVLSGGLYTAIENSWQLITVTAADFLSIDSTGLTADRQADGSLPDNNAYNLFLHLAETSNLIDAGTDLGYGDDLGAFQYEDFDPGEEITPVILTTTRPYWITQFDAISGGNVIDDGGAEVTQRGVVWDTNINPTIDVDMHTEDGSGTGVFVSTLVGLDDDEIYYVRAYAVNSEGPAYGDEYTFLQGQLLKSPSGKLIKSPSGNLVRGRIIIIE